MLQQTQVATVSATTSASCSAFPTVRALAAAPLDDVLHLWSGLGYYARARNLHRAAQLIVAEHGGELPQTSMRCRRCPASAVRRPARSWRFARAAAPILDGNVKRVLARYFGSRAGRVSAVEQRLWALAEECTPDERVAEYTQAIMDLGATLCVRRARCTACPLADDCAARIEDGNPYSGAAAEAAALCTRRIHAA